MEIIKIRVHKTMLSASEVIDTYIKYFKKDVYPIYRNTKGEFFNCIACRNLSCCECPVRTVEGFPIVNNFGDINCRFVKTTVIESRDMKEKVFVWLKRAKEQYEK